MAERLRKKGKSGNKKHGRDKRRPKHGIQLMRTWQNVQKRREKHREKHPRDKDSLARAKRWVEKPKLRTSPITA